MDLENDFFLVRFHNKDDYNKVEEEPFGTWMLVEQPQREKGFFSREVRKEDFSSGYGGSRFAAFGGDEGEIL
ncbi:hypothetical protein PVK06_024176 [Gossypium arboreum]|uniref:Uncharacterized protein n=1 Tax=Gossypium arboreum TaxID=29729 RepID=A0ABR0PDH2_GOSAR|nr:hypothetical protein PVK06_024176 [Gossypium arboreum]